MVSTVDATTSRTLTCTLRVVVVAIFAHIARSSAVIILAGAIARNYIANLVERTEVIAFAGCELCQLFITPITIVGKFITMKYLLLT